MKNLHLIIWLTQLGLSVACPLAGFLLLARWLQQRCELGQWVLFVAAGVGLCCAAEGFRSALRILRRLSQENKSDKAPPVSFNEHS